MRNCSDIDDIIIFYKDGTYKVIKVAEKVFVGETERSKAEKRKVEIIHVAVFKKNDTRTIYNATYKDGKTGVTYIKRFNVPSVTRDREYDLTMGTPKSKVTWFSANSNGEAEIIKITLKPMEKLKKLIFEKDFSEVDIKGRTARGNQLTKNEIFRIQLKAYGGSTLGGRQVWWDPDVQRINYDDHGEYLGEFHNNDQILVVLDDGTYYLSNFDSNNHYEQNIMRIEKYKAKKVWTAVLWDADNQNQPYIKRFYFEDTRKRQSYLGENENSRLILLTDTPFPRLQLTFNEPDTFRGPLEVDAEEYIAVKGIKAKGKRLTNFSLAEVKELEPTRFPSEEEEGDDEGPDDSRPIDVADPDEGKSDSEVRDEITGQLRLF